MVKFTDKLFIELGKLTNKPNEVYETLFHYVENNRIFKNSASDLAYFMVERFNGNI